MHKSTKRLLSLFIIIFGCGVIVSGQEKVIPNLPFKILRSTPGIISINEIQFGIGLGATEVPYSKSFFGFTTIIGYQVNKNLVTSV